MTQNRVKTLADARNWSVVELYRQVLLAQESVSQSTVERLYREPKYMASMKSLEAMARVFKVKVTELIEDVPEGQ